MRRKEPTDGKERELAKAVKMLKAVMEIETIKGNEAWKDDLWTITNIISQELGQILVEKELKKWERGNEQ